LLFNDLHSIPPEKRRPLTELFEQDALQVNSEQRLISARTGIMAVSPTLALKLARQIKDQRLRDYWLSDLVRFYLPHDTEQAQQLLTDLKDPLARAQGLVWLARDSRTNFNQAKSALEEANRLGWSHHLGPPAFSFGEILARFTASNYQEVVAFIQSQFPPHDAVIALCRMASVCRYERKDAEVAGRLLTVAAELVPTCQHPGAATGTLLHNGYAGQNRQHALELLDKFCQDQHKSFELLFTFVGTDIDTAIANAEQIADRWGGPKDQFIVGVLHRIDWGRNPKQALNWLEDTPRSLLRDAAIGSIAAGLNGYAKKNRTKQAPVQEWVDLLANYVLAIADTDQRWAACEAIRRLAEDHSAHVPKIISDQRVSLSSHPDPRRR